MSKVHLYWKPGWTGCVKARGFLAQSKHEFDQRDLLKQPLAVDELARLAKKAGGARELVAPKRREEAAAVPDAKLLEWLAADGKRVRRPILESGNKVTLGFTADVQSQWE